MKRVSSLVLGRVHRRCFRLRVWRKRWRGGSRRDVEATPPAGRATPGATGGDDGAAPTPLNSGPVSTWATALRRRRRARRRSRPLTRRARRRWWARGRRLVHRSRLRLRRDARAGSSRSTAVARRRSPSPPRRSSPPRGDTVIDGGGVDHARRRWHDHASSFRRRRLPRDDHGVTLQNLTLAHAKATGTPIPTRRRLLAGLRDRRRGRSDPHQRRGASRHRHHLRRERGGVTGPRRGRRRDLRDRLTRASTIVGSRFEGNTASNGGAVGSRNSDPHRQHRLFAELRRPARGPTARHEHVRRGRRRGRKWRKRRRDLESTAAPTARSPCAARRSRRTSRGALGGAISGHPTGRRRRRTFTQSTLDGTPRCKGEAPSTSTTRPSSSNASTISNNTRARRRRIQADGTTLQLDERHLRWNIATKGLGGAIALFGNGGDDDQLHVRGEPSSSGGSGYFAAAIAGGDNVHDPELALREQHDHGLRVADAVSGQGERCGRSAVAQGSRDRGGRRYRVRHRDHLRRSTARRARRQRRTDRDDAAGDDQPRGRDRRELPRDRPARSAAKKHGLHGGGGGASVEAPSRPEPLSRRGL